MAVTIKLKNASGSDPSASDLVVGEVALRTDTAKLFTKKDDNSVAEIGGASVADGSITSAKIADGAIVNADVNASAAIAGSKISPQFGSQDITATGNLSLSSGDITITSLAPTINLTDSNANDDFKIEVNSGSFKIIDATDSNDRFAIDSSGNITVSGTVDGRDLATDGTKLDGIESGATADQTASDIKTLLQSSKLTASEIANDTITATQLAAGAADVNVVLDGAITTGKLANDAVTYAKIQNVSATNRILGRDSSGAGVIEEITPANLRTMLNVADGATNVTNTNQLTNGAGFITATLTNEQVQDIVGGMLTGNTETGITVTYQDGDGTIDFVVGTLNQDTTGNAATATALETARNIGGVSFDGTGNINLPGVNTSGNQNTSGNAATATKLATARTIAGVSFDGSANISLNNNAITNGAGYLTSVGTSNIANDAVTNAKIADDAIEAAQLDNNCITTVAISNDAVTYAKIQNVSTDNRILGRNDGVGSGVVQELTPANIRSMINVADGATNVTNTNQLTNGAGFITSADGGNAATLDSIDSSQFARSDTADTLSGLMTFSGGISLGADARCAAGVSSLSDGSTITVNFTSGIHHSVTLGGNRTFGNPSNDSNAVGQCGSIFITQDGTGGRTASFHSDYKFVGGTAPTLSTAANAVDRLDYIIKASGVIHCVVSLDIK